MIRFVYALAQGVVDYRNAISNFLIDEIKRDDELYKQRLDKDGNQKTWADWWAQPPKIDPNASEWEKQRAADLAKTHRIKIHDQKDCI